MASSSASITANLGGLDLAVKVNAEHQSKETLHSRTIGFDFTAAWG